MSAKEEHARNVDMHKMRRQYTELTKQNAALETACASLKIAMKDAFDKCSTMRETMTTQYTEKMNEMKTEFENEKNRLVGNTNKSSKRSCDWWCSCTCFNHWVLCSKKNK